MVPPDSIPNSEVKRSNADGSVGFPHVRVGHHQGFIKVKKPQVRDSLRFFVLGIGEKSGKKEMTSGLNPRSFCKMMGLIGIVDKMVAKKWLKALYYGL